MAIYYDDIKLMKSQRLDDSDEGGGRMTGEEVVDGEINNLFPDISRLDRTYGRVQLRKAYPAVLTNTTNPFYGGHLIITKPAEDKNVACCMFTTKSSTDVRKDAVNNVEEYVIKGYRLFSYMLMGLHVAGAQTLLVQQNIDDDIPSANAVLYMCESNESNGEYVKIQKIEIKKEDKTTRQLELYLWAPTQFNHAGFHYDSNNRIVIDTYFYTTIVEDAVHYYGIKKLTESATNGANSIKVDGIFHNLVPCAQSSDALSDRDAVESFGDMLPTNIDKTKYTLADDDFTNVDGVVTIYAKRPLLPKTVTITDTTYNWISNDDGNGNITGAYSGTIDYETGRIMLNSSYSHHYTVSATPAVKPRTRRYTATYDVTLETRTTVFARTLIPKPVAGTLKIQYRAQGNWYTLEDKGDGTISGTSPSYGSGTIDYETGTFNVSIGALPDVNTSLLFSWGTNIHYISKTAFSAGKPYIELETQNPIVPGTLSITYTASGATKTVTDNNGVLEGDGTGSVDYSTKKIKLIPNYLPDIGSGITIDYTEVQELKTQTFHISDITDNGNGTYTINLGAGFTAGTLDLTFLAGIPGYDYSSVTDTLNTDIWSRKIAYKSTYGHKIGYDPAVYKVFLKDDGNGHLLNDPNSSIDYTNGTITFSKSFSRKTYKETKDSSSWSSNTTYTNGDVNSHASDWSVSSKILTTATFSADVFTTDTNTFTVNYADAASSTTHSEDVTEYSLKAIAREIESETIIPGSLFISFNGKTIIDDNGGLYNELDATNGQWGSKIGTFDYTGAIIELTDWQGGASISEMTVEGALFTPCEIVTSNMSFTTDACPIQVGSFQLVFTRADTGEQVSVFADSSGAINGNGIVGMIDYQTGIANLQFGDWVVDDATAQEQDWYDASRVSGGNVLKPIPVFSESVKYNAVAIEYIPLDASILGLNPLRLPTDGKVPIYRKGDVAIIFNLQQYTMPDNLTAGQTITLPRGSLSYVDLFDSDGKYVDKQWYSVNLETGVITMSDPLDLSAYTQPLIAYHRREDMRLLSDVSIDGTLTLIEPIEHDYDTDYTYVSSALLMGDLYASVYNVFDQKNWTNVWSDSLIGDPCTANFNLIDYPISTTNKGAIKERWAIIFTSSTEFKVVGEIIGEIAYGNTSEDCAPINPETQTPYFVIKKDGWGGGWATNNVLRFNTTAAHYPVWFIRTVLIGDALADDDNFRIQIRGDAD